MFRPLTIDEIGGAKVARKIDMGGVARLRGEELTLEELRRMPTANRNALIENRIIEVWPRRVTFERGPAAAPVNPGGQRHVYARGFGKYDVVEGTVLAQGLTREEADAMAGKQARAPDGIVAPKAKSPPTKKKRRKSGGAAVRKPAPPPPDSEQNNGPIES